MTQGEASSAREARVGMALTAVVSRAATAAMVEALKDMMGV